MESPSAATRAGSPTAVASGAVAGASSPPQPFAATARPSAAIMIPTRTGPTVPIAAPTASVFQVRE